MCNIRSPLKLGIGLLVLSAASFSSAADKPRSPFIVVLERSSAIRPFLSAYAPAVAAFVDELTALKDANLRPSALIVYSATSIVIPDPTHQTTDAIRNMKAVSNGGMAEALSLAYIELTKTATTSSKAGTILLVTTGRPNGITADFASVLKSSSKCKARDKLIGAVANGAVSIRTVSRSMPSTASCCLSINRPPCGPSG